MSIVIHTWSGEIPNLRIERESHSLGSEMPKDVLKQRSRRYVLRKMHGDEPGWCRVVSPNAVVRGDLSREDLRGVAALSEELQVMLRTYLGGSSHPVLYSSRIFSDWEQYRHKAARAGAANAESYYDPRSTEIVMSFRKYPSAIFQKYFAHEFVHAYVDRTFGKTDPLWLMEGVAEWFSNIRWRAGILIPGQEPPWDILIALKNMPFTLSDLLVATREQAYGMHFKSYYALGWAAVDYLMYLGLLREAIVDSRWFDVKHYRDGFEKHLQLILS